VGLVCQSRTRFVTLTATHCNTLQHTATHCNILQHTHLPVRRIRSCESNTISHSNCDTLRHTATHCNTLQHTHLTVRGSCLCEANTFSHADWNEHTATHCNTLQLTAMHCNTHTCQFVGLVCARRTRFFPPFRPGFSFGEHSKVNLLSCSVL